MLHGSRSLWAASLRLAVAALVIGLTTFETVLTAGVADATNDVVSTCANSGTGSLPAVVASAASGDTITFSVSCPPSSPITLASTINLNTNLTINGPGANDLAVSGNKAVEVFSIASGVTASISGITVEDGHNSEEGGGIYTGGNPTATGRTV